MSKKLYEDMAYGESLGWCTPYMSDDERNAIVINEGRIDGMLCDGEYIRPEAGPHYSSGQIQRFARAINPDYGYYTGWDDIHIILEALSACGCSDCPWRDSCEAMDVDD